MAKRKKSDLKDPKDPKTSAGSVILPAAGAALGHLLFPGLGGILAGGVAGKLISEMNEDKPMNKVPIFYSFHFNNDVMRVQQIRNIGSIEGNPPVNPNEWEKIKQKGDNAVQTWIDENMKYKRCVVVLIGAQTASRPWVLYEIERAWNIGKALVGIHVHNIKCPRTGTCRKGINPFDKLSLKSGAKLSSVVPVYDPGAMYAYTEIQQNIGTWVNAAIQNKRN
jgi:hypothetical protein